MRHKLRVVWCCGPSGSPSRRHIIIFVLLHNIAALLFGWSRQACPARRMLSTRPPSASLQCLRWRCRNSCALPNRPFGVVASCARLAFLRCCLRTSAAHAQAALARTRRYEAVLLGVGVNVSREKWCVVLHSFFFFTTHLSCFPCLRYFTYLKRPEETSSLPVLASLAPAGRSQPLSFLKREK